MGKQTFFPLDNFVQCARKTKAKVITNNLV